MMIHETGKTVKEYFDTWLKYYKFPNIKATSYDVLERTVEKHIYPSLGDTLMIKVEPIELRKLLNVMQNNGYSYSMRKKVYDALKACFKFAVIQYDMERSPMLGIDPPVNDEIEEIYVYDEKEIKQIIREATKTYRNGSYVYFNGPAFVLILHTGLRCGEVLGLKWSDYDPKNQCIKVRSDVEYIEERNEDLEKTGKQIAIRQNTPKSKSSIREIHLNNTANSIIQMLYTRQKKMKIDSEYILCTKNGKFVTPGSFRKTFGKIVDNTNVQRAGIHALRHTFATQMYHKGVEVKKISAILGHSSVKITYDTYIHLWKGALDTATDVLDETFKLDDNFGMKS